MQVRAFSVGLALAALAGGGHRARASDDDDGSVKPLPAPQPILTADEARHEAPISRQWIDVAARYDHLHAAATDDNADAFSIQLAAGPMRFKRTVDYVLGDVLGWLNDYSWRARWTHVQLHDGTTREGPITLALQRFFTPDTLNVATLIHLHLGLEASLATPWLDDRRAAPPIAFRRLYATQPELSHNGYSIQPLGAYVRGDLLLCRNIFGELGLSPEVFVPTESDRTHEYGVRWHLAVGFNLACSSDPDSWSRPLAIALEMQGRGKLDSADGSPHHDVLNSIALQYHVGSRWVFDVFGSRANGVSLDQYFVLGARIQVGLGERSEQ